MATVVEGMQRAALDLRNLLDDAQRARACLPFADDTGRRDWHYIPRSRGGLSFRRMDADQQERAYRLLASGLSHHAFAQASTIIALEDVLDLLEGNDRGRHRHRADYSTSIFGSPESDATWGWRFEGHHISVNITVVDGAIAPTPMFLGANPAEVASGSRSVVRPLAAEEDIARELLLSLDESQRAEAIVSGDAPDDILTTAEPRLDAANIPEPAGVAAASLSGPSATAFDELLATYVNRLPTPLVAERLDQLRAAGRSLRFAWCGGAERHQRHYYRIQGDGVLIEYDNTQNEANHIHTVWRDPQADFGEDLLRTHYQRHHAP